MFHVKLGRLILPPWHRYHSPGMHTLPVRRPESLTNEEWLVNGSR